MKKRKPLVLASVRWSYCNKGDYVVFYRSNSTIRYSRKGYTNADAESLIAYLNTRT